MKYASILSQRGILAVGPEEARDRNECHACKQGTSLQLRAVEPDISFRVAQLIHPCQSGHPSSRDCLLFGIQSVVIDGHIEVALESLQQRKPDFEPRKAEFEPDEADFKGEFIVSVYLPAYWRGVHWTASSWSRADRGKTQANPSSSC